MAIETNVSMFLPASFRLNDSLVFICMHTCTEVVLLLEYLAHLAEKESEKGEDDEVRAASKIRQLVQLESRCNREEDDLHSNGDNRAYREVVLV